MKNLDDFNVYHPGLETERSGRIYTDINNIMFCVQKTDRSLLGKVSDLVVHTKDLDEVYEDPSPAKINKYNIWKCWADQIRNLYSFGIVESTNKDFTLSGYLELDYDKIAIITIKPGKYLPDACCILMEQ